MEKIFNARWWDYSKNKFNINGRICLETLIPFGIISVIVICFANPWILSKLYLIPHNVLNCLVLGLAIVYITDACISFKVILNFKNLSKQAKDNTEEITKKVKETTDAAIKRLTSEKEKLLRKMNIRKYKIVKNIKYTSRNYKTKIKNQELTLIGTFKMRIQNIDDNIRSSVKDMTDKIRDGQLKLCKDLKDKFIKQSKLNKRLISAFPNLEQKDYTRKKKNSVNNKYT